MSAFTRYTAYVTAAIYVTEYKWLNTLYLDKCYGWSNIEMVIQAFSRTNRIYDNDKPHGIIRYYRRPYTMKNIIAYAFGQYSGNKPYGIFVPKLKENLQAMNQIYAEIKNLFELSGCPDFSKLPEDVAEKRKFSKLFKDLNQHLEPAKVQGFVWDKLTYEFDTADDEKEAYSLDFDEEVYNALLMRYKELKRGRTSSGEEEPYDIEPYLMSLSTEKIDSDYMDSRFRQYAKMLHDQADEETRNALLNDLHRSFAGLSREEQQYANILLRDVQNQEIVLSDDKNIWEYITEYRTRAQNERIRNFAKRLGVNEKRLRELMEMQVSEQDINAFGRFDYIMQSADITIAKEYFDQLEGMDVPRRKVRQRLNAYLRKFIFEGGFDV